MAIEKEKPEFRVLMFPWLAHGHIFPFLELAKILSATKCFTIYICSTAVNLDSLRSSLEKHKTGGDDASIKLIELHLSAPPEVLPPLLQTTKNLPPNLFPSLRQAFRTSTSSFSNIIDSVQPHLLIYDFFQAWAAKMAASKGIPPVFFSTYGATPFCYNHHEYTMGTASTFPYKAIFLKDHERFTRDTGQDPVCKIEGAGFYDFAFRNFTWSSDIVLMKSCPEIEEKYIDYLSVLCKKQIVSTGLLVGKAKPYDEEESGEMFQWLSGKNQGSTVFVSFGSECFLSKKQIAEIAKGLQLCQVNFLWVIRFPVGEEPSSVEAALPTGFLESVKERGFVIGRWAPQVNILAHPSIGGFVSHCGWSSVTESLYYGVPVVAMPMLYEQPLNARVVVEAGVGVEVERDENGGFVGEDVAKAINKLMVENYESMSERIKVISQKIKENEKRHGEDVAEQLMRICIKNHRKQI